MYLKSLELKNFKNYESLNIELNKGINILCGKNAQGKTNLLESIYVLGLTKTHSFFNDNNSLELYEFPNSLMVIIWTAVNYLSSHKRHTIVTQVLVGWVYF